MGKLTYVKNGILLQVFLLGFFNIYAGRLKYCDVQLDLEKTNLPFP